MPSAIAAAVDEVRISTFCELIDWLYAGSWMESLGRFRSNFVFRGMGDASYDLQTSLHRLGTMAESMESHLLRNFRKYAGQDAVTHDSIWNWLALAQHHGLPTRLLFPGLDGLSRWLERYYTSAPKAKTR